MNFLACSYGSMCSGCDWLLLPYSEQQARKKQHLFSVWQSQNQLSDLPELNWVTIKNGGLRDRVDLSLDRRSGRQKLGLFDRVHREIIDLQGCPQLSPGLESWLHDFRRIEIPIARGSVRLRVSPSAVRGVWLDLANIDVKQLLEERTCLDQLRALGIVEIGQKRKRLVERGGQLKLDEPCLEAWFETYAAGDLAPSTMPLYCSLGSFTQPGFLANRALIGEVLKMVTEPPSRRKLGTVAEFGSGIGNFTLPLAKLADKVHAFEVDRLALEGLRRSSREQGLDGQIEIFQGNFQDPRAAAKNTEALQNLDLVLVDPPRSGLMGFLDPIEKLSPTARPKRVIYVSCFAESFAQDAARLSGLDYAIEKISIVDQFPQSRHFEIVASFAQI